jgi:hypothetical protein
MNITVKKKNAHSEVVFKAIDEHLRAIITLLDVSSDLDGMVQLLEMILLEDVANLKIEQINIVADTRNNKISNTKNGKYNIDVYYRHKNCYNITQLSYTIQQ